MPKRATPPPTGPTRTHPALVRRLAQPSGGPVGVVCRLRPRRAADVALGPDETERTARALLDRVKRAVGEEPARWNVFRNLGALAAVASAVFVRELVEQPEVEAATPNRLPEGEDLLIRPVKKRPARRAGRKGHAPRQEKG